MADDRAYEELRVGFTAAVSHELRTPLARLLVLLETIERAPERAVELASQAAREVEEMRDLIDDVLFLSELESGREVVALTKTAALPLLEEEVAKLRERGALSGVQLSVEGDPTLELPLRPRMLRVVAANLCANAIRYAGDGARFTLEIREDAGRVELLGRDDGVGVSPEELPRLFERFYRAEPARTSRGTGLGLAIVKHIIVAAGGLVEAESTPGEGLRIRCSFPIR